MPGLTRCFHSLLVALLPLHLVQDPGVSSVQKGSLEWKWLDHWVMSHGLVTPA